MALTIEEKRARHAAAQRRYMERKRAEKAANAASPSPTVRAANAADEAERKARHAAAQRKYYAKKKAEKAAARSASDKTPEKSRPDKAVKPKTKPATDKAAEKRAKHAAAQRASRQRLGSLTKEERSLMKAARTYGITNINSTNVKEFAEYIQYRYAQLKDSYNYSHFTADMEAFSDLQKEKVSASQIWEDFRQYNEDRLTDFDEYSISRFQDTKSRYMYSAAEFEKSWQRYVEEIRENSKKKGRR